MMMVKLELDKNYKFLLEITVRLVTLFTFLFQNFIQQNTCSMHGTKMYLYFFLVQGSYLLPQYYPIKHISFPYQIFIVTKLM